VKFDVSEYQVSILFSIFYITFLYHLNLFFVTIVNQVSLIFGCEL